MFIMPFLGALEQKHVEQLNKSFRFGYQIYRCTCVGHLGPFHEGPGRLIE